MNKQMFSNHPSSAKETNQCGMTLIESLIAMTMLVVFTGVVASVMQFTVRFFNAAEESIDQNVSGVSNGVLIDHQQLQLAMDDLVEVLSQPGISLSKIAFPLGAPFAPPAVACPAASPVGAWNLPMQEVSLPPGYRLCLWETTAVQKNSISALNKGAKRDVYILQALPERLSSTNLSTRRLFCRPRPFCAP